MAEFVISSAIEVLEFLLQKKVPPYFMSKDLKFLVDEKAAILKGSEEHLQGLKTDLKIMLDFLIESSGSRNLNHLISQVREMAHDAGVIVDTFIFIKSEEVEAIRLNDFLREIKSIRIRFREVNLQSPVEEEEDDGGRHWHRRPSWEGEDEDTVGLAGPVKTLIHSFILSRQRWRFSVMIIGMGGVGKTTLARKLYNHVVVAKRFECRGWACVSSEFRPEEVIKVLIRQVVKLEKEEEEVMERMSLRRLKDMLRQHLHGKRYFIVLDCVWDDTSFKHVLFALPREENSSRVLLTCRCKNKVEVVDCTFSLDPLSSDASWQLFLKMVFTNDHKCPRHLEKIGRKIVKMCNGLPLAIKEAGRKLAMKSQTESAWEEFLESIDFSETIAVLELSYHKLSQELKSCFVHASFFKKGTTISVEKFIHIWIAAGMAMRVKVEDYAKMEARKYLDKLCDEYMIILVYSPIKKELKSLYLDSFHHKISITKAEEEIYLQILGNEKHSRQPCKPRHCVICCSRDKFNYSTKQEKHLISLFFHGGGIFDATPSYWESFEQLRILDFEGFGLKSLSERVCALGRLRYLGLRDNYIQELPHTLGRLKNLEVLDIASNFMLEVPDIIWEMDNLRHLYLSDIICRTPLKIDSLKYLQTLTYVSADNWTYEVSNLENMTSLRKLGIEELDESSNVSNLFASLAKLKNLQCLILRGFRFRSMPPLDDLSVLKEVYQIKLDGRLAKLPKFPKGIRSLTLVNSCLDEDPMPELEKIFFLSYLKLRNAYTGQEMVFSRRGSRIEKLCIVELWHLRNLRVEKSFSNYLLRKLEICNCPFLNNIPKEMIAFASDKWYWEGVEIVTTNKIAKAIRQSVITRETHVGIQP